MPAKRKPQVQKLQKRTTPAFDPVAEAGAESFPASDAPAFPSAKETRADVKSKKKSR